MGEKVNPLDSALQQLAIAAEMLNLDPNIYEILKYPKRTLTVSVPVSMDNSSVLS